MYLEHGSNAMLKQRLNRDVETTALKELIIEACRNEVSMHHRELKHLLSQPVLDTAESEVVMEEDEPLLDTSKSKVVMDEDKPVLDTDQTHPTEGTQGDPVPFSELPTEVKQGIRLRQEFPFLSDPDCPVLLKALVADKITAFHTYRDAHTNLFKDGLSPEEFEQSAQQLVENYLENRLIYDELVHYKNTNQILGKHPIWKREQVSQELLSLSDAEKVKKINNLRTYYSRDKAKLAELTPEDPKYGSFVEKVENWKWQLNILGDVQP